MKSLFFNDRAFSYEALRAAAYAPYDGADIGEVLATTERIEEGDWDGWHDAWFATAARVERAAESARAAGHLESARAAYLRASNYYRTAEFFVRDDPDGDPRLVDAWRRSAHAFTRAAELATPAWRPIEIPYGGTVLSGYFLPADAEGPRPTLLAHGGFDSTLEEMYFAAAAPALRRGWNALIFEGPGQGAALRMQGLVFRPDWEAVVTPVVDFAQELPTVDTDRLALLGMSLGGLLAPRAAAFEPRLAACVALDGVHNLRDALSHAVSDESTPVTGPAERLEALQKLIDARKSLPSHLRWMLSNGLWVFGVNTAKELVATLSAYDLTDVAGKITCPTLVLEAEADHFFPGQPRRLYDSLTGPKRLIRFTSEEGGAEHCHMGALALAHQRIFDWLDETV